MKPKLTLLAAISLALPSCASYTNASGTRIVALGSKATVTTPEGQSIWLDSEAGFMSLPESAKSIVGYREAGDTIRSLGTSATKYLRTKTLQAGKTDRLRATEAGLTKRTAIQAQPIDQF